ncbi:MAG: GTP 3',8-cyclase MoaA [Agarilytica sp.]
MQLIPTLSDNYGRRFNYLRLSVTEVCNFRCNYCLPDGFCGSKNNDELSLYEIEKLVSAFALNGTTKVRITGGEPTLRKDLVDIVRVCNTIEGIDTIAMTSNGYKIQRDLPDLVDAGLNALNLSVDSLDAAKFNLITGHNKLKRVLDGIEQAIDLGVSSVKLNAVLLREFNENEIHTFIDYVKTRPVSFRFIELMRTNDNQAFFEKQHVSGESICRKLEDSGWDKVAKACAAGPAQEYAHPDYEGKIGLIMPYSKDFCQSCNRLRLSSTGNLHLCLFEENHTPLRAYIESESVPELAARIRKIVLGKNEHHFLHDGVSGSTDQLAMIGG